MQSKHCDVFRALLLASPEIRFEVSSETNDPIDVVSKPMLETNSMVEEFMLLANISVAEHIFKNFPECAVLRRHPVPPASNFEPIIKAGKTQVTLFCGLKLCSPLSNVLDLY